MFIREIEDTYRFGNEEDVEKESKSLANAVGIVPPSCVSARSSLRSGMCLLPDPRYDLLLRRETFYLYWTYLACITENLDTRRSISHIVHIRCDKLM